MYSISVVCFFGGGGKVSKVVKRNVIVFAAFLQNGSDIQAVNGSMSSSVGLTSNFF